MTKPAEPIFYGIAKIKKYYKCGITFVYKRIRLGASKRIPKEYAKQILKKK